jgi:hypothetical protein
MKKKSSLSQENSPKKNKHQVNAIQWEELNDIQKTRACLDARRLLDHDQFILDFKSWEFPALD